MNARLTLTGITKKYPSVVANDGVEPDRAAGRNPCRAGRERRRQVHADEDHLRRGPARRRARCCGTAAKCAIANPADAPPAGHRHGVPALLPVRHADRGREHRAGPAAGQPDSTTLAARITETVAASYGLPLDPQRHVHTLSVGERQRVEIVRCLLPDPQPADHGRADLGADAAGGGEAVRHAAPAGRRRLQHPLHQPQARRDPGAVRHARPSCAAAASPAPATRARKRAASLARMMIGADLPHIANARSHTPGGGAAGGRRPVAGRRADPFGTELQDIGSTVRAGEIVGIAGVSGNGQQELLAALSGEDPRAAHDAIRLDGRPVGPLRCRAAPARPRPGLRARGTAGARRGAGSCRWPTMRCCRTSGRGHGAAGHGPLRRDRRAWPAPSSSRFDVKAGGPQARGPQPVGRQPAEIHRRPRNAAGSPRLLVIAQPTWGVDVGAAAPDPPGTGRPARRRARGAGDFGRAGRTVRDLRPDRA